MSGPPPPFIWRAGSGYIPPPYATNPPQPVAYVQVPDTLPLNPMYVNNNHQYFYPPPPPPFLNAPVPIPAPAQTPVQAPPAAPKKQEKKKASAPPPPPPPASTIVSAASTKVSSTASAASTALPPNLNAAPPLRQGTNYMFPPEHTMLHIFNRASQLWLPKYANRTFDFKMFKVGTGMSPQMVIENTLNKRGKEACEGWAVTEVHEKGAGRWAKGTTVAYTDDRATGSLASMGWTAKRGDKLPPVWLVVHKV